AGLHGVTERVGLMREGAGIEDDGVHPLVGRREQPADQVPLMVRLLPPDRVAELDGPPFHVLHDLCERLRSVGIGVALPERPHVGTEEVEHVHTGAPISWRMRRTSSGGTSSTMRGRPTSSSRTKRTPSRNFLSSWKAWKISSAGGMGPSGASPRDDSSRSVRAVSPSSPMPTASLNRAANTIPRSEEHTSELQSRFDLVCRLLLEKKKKKKNKNTNRIKPKH